MVLNSTPTVLNSSNRTPEPTALHSAHFKCNLSFDIAISGASKYWQRTRPGASLGRFTNVIEWLIFLIND